MLSSLAAVGGVISTIKGFQKLWTAERHWYHLESSITRDLIPSTGAETPHRKYVFEYPIQPRDCLEYVEITKGWRNKPIDTFVNFQFGNIHFKDLIQSDVSAQLTDAVLVQSVPELLKIEKNRFSRAELTSYLESKYKYKSRELIHLPPNADNFILTKYRLQKLAYFYGAFNFEKNCFEVEVLSNNKDQLLSVLTQKRLLDGQIFYFGLSAILFGLSWILFDSQCPS